MIKFKTVRWRNLLSTGNVFTEIDLNSGSNTLIVGANGSGKSTILDAICFALFGKPFRNINKPQLVNSINDKNMLVEVEFSVGKIEFLVRRGIKPAIFEIVQDGVLINQTASARDYQVYLERNVLKLTFKSFTQIVILGSSSFVPFMQLSAAHRREIIEDLLDISIFSVMNTLLKDKIATNRDDIVRIASELKLVREKMTLERKYIKEIETNKSEKIDHYRQQIAKKQENITLGNEGIAFTQKNIAELQAKALELSKINVRYQKLVSVKDDLTKSRVRVEKSVSFYETNDVCPTCNQKIEDHFKHNLLHDKRKKLGEIDTGLTDVTGQVNDALKIIDQLSTINDEIFELTRSVQVSQRDVDLCIQSIKHLETEIKALESNQDTTKAHTLALSLLEGEEDTYNRAYEEAIEERSLLDMAQELLKDRGIKSRIIKQYIPVINKLINKYLAQMDFFVNFELDENFKESIKSRHRDEFTYENFSEGEKSRIDLALLLTWRAVAKLKNSVSTNLLIMDEVFDGSMDSQGTEELLKILTELGEETNLFVISHKTDSMIDKFERVLKAEKRKNFSVITEG